MTFKNLAEAVDETLASITGAVSHIERKGESADLRALRRHLLAAMSLFQRNPGIEAAADDLYAAAAAVVADQTHQARQRRILRDAHLRFRGRLEGAAERVERYEYLVVPESLVRRAA